MKENYRYGDLTYVQLEQSNGCGSSFFLAFMFRLPRCLFPKISRCCDCHDIGYPLAKTIEEKQALDDQLVEDFLEWARAGNNWFVRRWRFGVANVVWWSLDTALSEMCWRWTQR
jgi:hypothetical protein